MENREKTDLGSAAAPRYKQDDSATLNADTKATLHTSKAGDILQRAGFYGDEALKALELEKGETIVIDAETNRKLVRKIGNLPREVY